MKKMITRVSGLALAICLAIPLGSTALATEIPADTQSTKIEEMSISPRADTLHYHVLKNKTYLRSKKNILDYLTEYWANASQYVVQKTKSRTSSLGVTAKSGSFPFGAVSEASVGFTHSISESFSVGTYVPADSSRKSKRTIQEKKKIYSADLYYVIDFGSSQSSSYKGSGEIAVPEDLYLEVVYQ